MDERFDMNDHCKRCGLSENELNTLKAEKEELENVVFMVWNDNDVREFLPRYIREEVEALDMAKIINALSDASVSPKSIPKGDKDTSGEGEKKGKVVYKYKGEVFCEIKPPKEPTECECGYMALPPICTKCGKPITTENKK